MSSLRPGHSHLIYVLQRVSNTTLRQVLDAVQDEIEARAETAAALQEPSGLRMLVRPAAEPPTVHEINETQDLAPTEDLDTMHDAFDMRAAEIEEAFSKPMTVSEVQHEAW